MDIKEEKKANATVFIIKGRLDSATSPEVEKKIIDSIQHGSNKVVLDFAGLDYISSAGIRVLVHCHKELEKKEGEIVLANVSKAIENVLYITGFLPYFKVYESQAQALGALNPSKD